MNAQLSIHMCPQCGIGFEPKQRNHVFCCPQHCDAYHRTHPEGETWPREGKCEECGGDFEKRSDNHVFCSPKCKKRASTKRLFADPARKAARREYEKRLYQKLKDERSEKRRQLKASRKEETVTQVDPDPWTLPAPSLEYLPGGFMSLALDPPQTLKHWQLSCLHGAMTSLTGPHAPHVPKFSLFPWPSGCGWAAHVADEDVARSIASGYHTGALRDSLGVVCGALVRVRAPRVAPGRYRLRVDAITPIHIRSYGSTVIRTTPTARHLRGTLEGFMPARLGLRIEPGQVQMELIENHTHQEYIPLAGRVRDFGKTAGLVGHVVVETNAVGEFLLKCCALGLGYGGKVAFGFGRIRVTEIK